MAMSVNIDEDLKHRVQSLAEQRQRSAHWILREAIRQYVEREEKLQALREDALSAWAAYQADGLHVTSSEADAWLASLEAGEDAEPPPCHD